MKQITLKERVTNLENQYQEVLNQLASMDNPNDGINLIKARERLMGAIELGKVLLEEEPKEDKNATKSSTK